MKVLTKIADELNAFMVDCLKRHAAELDLEEHPARVVIAALIEALAMQVVFHGVTNDQAIWALKLMLNRTRKRQAGGEQPPKTHVNLTPRSKA